MEHENFPVMTLIASSLVTSFQNSMHDNTFPYQ